MSKTIKAARVQYAAAKMESGPVWFHVTSISLQDNNNHESDKLTKIEARQVGGGRLN